MIGIAIVVAVSVATPAAVAERQVLAVMSQSAAGWNVGDLDRFMRVYSDGPETSFVTKEGIVRGKVAIAARYRPRFTGNAAATRGTLSFETLHFTLLDARHALLVARYRLKVTGKADQTGPTSLIFVRERTGWRIVADHSS